MPRRISRLVGLAVVACGVAGCVTPQTQIASRSDAADLPKPKRLLVVSQLAVADKAWAAPFETALLAELRPYRIQARVQSRIPVAVQSDKARYGAEVTAYKPDAVLVVEPGDGTADAQGRPLMRRFEAGLFRDYTDRQRRELVWRASIALQPTGYYIDAPDMATLARDIVAKLTRDGVLVRPPRETVAKPKPAPVKPKPVSGWRARQSLW